MTDSTPKVHRRHHGGRPCSCRLRSRREQLRSPTPHDKTSYRSRIRNSRTNRQEMVNIPLLVGNAKRQTTDLDCLIDLARRQVRPASKRGMARIGKAVPAMVSEGSGIKIFIECCHTISLPEIPDIKYSPGGAAANSSAPSRIASNNSKTKSSVSRGSRPARHHRPLQRPPRPPREPAAATRLHQAVQDRPTTHHPRNRRPTGQRATQWPTKVTKTS